MELEKDEIKSGAGKRRTEKRRTKKVGWKIRDCQMTDQKMQQCNTGNGRTKNTNLLIQGLKNNIFE